MESLVQTVIEKTGLPEAQARQAVEVVLNFIRERLPDTMEPQFNAILQSDLGGTLNQAQSMLGGLSGMFGKKEE